MEVRAKDGKGPLLFEWDPETQTVDLIRKDMYYKVHLDKHSYVNPMGYKRNSIKFNCKLVKES